MIAILKSLLLVFCECFQVIFVINQRQVGQKYAKIVLNLKDKGSISLFMCCLFDKGALWIKNEPEKALPFIR